MKNISNTSLPSSTFSEAHTRLILIAILSLYPLVGMGIDLIAPSLPAITQTLQTSSIFSKNLITFFLVGYMMGNFLIGFLSDALGRRKLMMLGFFVFSAVSLLPCFWSKPSLLLLSRFLQGISIAAFAVSSRAVLSDILPKEKLIRTATLIATMWGIGPIIGPIIGGYLQYYFNWQACFYLFSCLGFLGFLAMVFIIPETNFSRQPLQYKQLKSNFLTILTHKSFLGIVLLMGITYSLLIVFNTLAPFLVQTSLGYSSIYFGHIAFCMGLTFLVGTFICRLLLKHFSPERIFFLTLNFLLVTSIVSTLFAFYHEYSIKLIIGSSLCMFLGCGIIYPTAMGKGLSLFRHLAGSGSAIMNLITMSITSLISLAMSFLYVSNTIIMIFIYLSLVIIARINYYTLLHLPKAQHSN